MTPPFDVLSFQYEFGKRLKSIRESKAMLQHELANRVGVVPNTISNIERGFTFPSLGAIINMAMALDVHPKILLFGEEPCPTTSKSQ